ncbi:nuclear transport factor 2 family protein [Sphingomonas koreensis]
MIEALALLLAAPAAASPAPPVQAAATTEAAVLEKLNHDWLTAYRTRDRAALDRILADDFEAIYPGGRVLRKADLLASVSSTTRTITKISWDNLKIMVFGDVAMVAARSHIEGTGPDGAYATSNDYADVYVKRGGTWRAISAHVVRAAPSG